MIVAERLMLIGQQIAVGGVWEDGRLGREVLDRRINHGLADGTAGQYRPSSNGRRRA